MDKENEIRNLREHLDNMLVLDNFDYKSITKLVSLALRARPYEKTTDRQVPELKGYIIPNPGSQGAYLFVGWCPYCRDWHGHGIPASDIEISVNGLPIVRGKQHRAAHCSYIDSPFKDTGYWIKPFSIEDLKRIQEDPRN